MFLCLFFFSFYLNDSTWANQQTTQHYFCQFVKGTLKTLIGPAQNIPKIPMKEEVRACCSHSQQISIYAALVEDIPLCVFEDSFLRKYVSSFSSSSSWAQSLADFIISIKLCLFCPVVLLNQFQEIQHKYVNNPPYKATTTQ